MEDGGGWGYRQNQIVKMRVHPRDKYIHFITTEDMQSPQKLMDVLIEDIVMREETFCMAVALGYKNATIQLIDFKRERI